MKRLIRIAIVLALTALTFPLANLVMDRKANPSLWAKVQDEKLKALAPTLAQKCANCHTDKTAMPFYAGFPVASGIIEKDIQQGSTFWNLMEEVFSGGEVSEAALAKLQFEIEQDAMPPARYRLLHWGSALTAEEKGALLGWIRAARAKANGGDEKDPVYANIVLPLVEPKGLNPEKVALGRKLYHDTKLSGDNTVSCASCHDLKKGGTDQAQFSAGIKGQKGGINAPTSFNAALAVLQFWDGRAADLKAQAAGPVENPVEMGEKWDNVPGKLQQDAEYVATFAKLYPEGITKDSVTDAIAEFEKTLITVNSRFDEFLRGRKDAVNVDEHAGYKLFLEHGCQKCHAGQALGGESFEKMGLYGDYFAARGNLTDADNGRFSVTKKDSDKHKFKVPTLRNVALTFPYFHDGTKTDLKEVVKLMGRHQLGKELADRDVELIVKFLQTLTGTLDGKPL